MIHFQFIYWLNVISTVVVFLKMIKRLLNFSQKVINLVIQKVVLNQPCVITTGLALKKIMKKHSNFSWNQIMKITSMLNFIQVICTSTDQVLRKMIKRPIIISKSLIKKRTPGQIFGQVDVIIEVMELNKIKIKELSSQKNLQMIIIYLLKNF